MPPDYIDLFQTHYELLVGANRQVTFSEQNAARAESAVAINPLNPANMTCASKRFYDRANYKSSIGISFTKDGGQSWTEVPLPPTPNHPEFTWLVDPDVAFDGKGNAYLWAEPVDKPPGLETIAMVAYRSTDGGASYTETALLHNDNADDKGWIAADERPFGAHAGTLYAVWGASTPLRFAKSTDHGSHWTGVGGGPAGADVFPPHTCFAPAMGIDGDGVVHVAWQIPGTSTLTYTRSKDGGQSFEPFRTVASGIVTFSSALNSLEGWPVLPGATFRLLTMATLAIDGAGRVMVAWPDMRQGVGRIYMALSTDGGDTWPVAMSSVPIDPTYPLDQNHQFMPQLACAGGVFGCAYYEFDATLNPRRIHVKLTPLWPAKPHFDPPVIVTSHPWDPAINAPIAHNTTSVTFIGDYFGIAAGDDFFELVWTDTRTGLQELFSCNVEVKAHTRSVPEIVATIVAGVIQDGGGWVIIGGHIVRIPPWDPGIDILHGLAAVESAKQIKGAVGRTLEAQALKAVATLAANAAKVASAKAAAQNVGGR
ncbi:WD40/YVTN/BNR-like repeat-containing protein [Rhizobium sp. RAF56]|uniref:WD40/YVTN/BNR-like repeat-containing protein n=1 Tax=Rhizobium sp. RAF56 TaxID=3233062 RepID=UPI003F9CD42A